MINVVKRGVFALAMAAGLGLVAVTPGQAAETTVLQRITAAAIARCPDGDVCLFQHDGYSGDAALFPSPRTGLRPYGFNDRASSICNNTSSTIRFWQHEGYDGYRRQLNSGYCLRVLRDFGMGPYGDTWNDEISSWSWA